jgi:glycosyltransferase involved in cell wall biosynthesis
MIVKNEAPVVARCLASLRALIRYWVIVDTGSTDGTQDAIRTLMAGVPGELHERPWRDFASNRSEALALARPHGDYSLIVDADDVIEVPIGFQLPQLSADSYFLDIRDTNLRYQRAQIVRNTLPWRYRGVLHEFLTCEDAKSSGYLPIVMRRHHDGARRRDPETYKRDAAVLENALAAEDDPFLIARYTFYLAQSYRDSGDKRKSAEAYLRRAHLGYWEQEVFYSLYQAARLKEEMKHDVDEIISLQLRASDTVPDRAEALHAASRLCRNVGRNQQGYEIAKRGLALSPPKDGLFVEDWIYEYGLLDEFSVNAYWSGHHRDCLDASLKILTSGKLPASEIQRVAANAQFASKRLPDDANLKSLGTESFVDQYPLKPPRTLRTRSDGLPRVLIAILAKQHETSLGLYLQCIEAFDYPKSSVVLYVRTNNNTDNTEAVLRQWLKRVGSQYAHVELDAENVATPVEQYGVHEWNAARFRVLGHIRNVSLQKTIEHNCQFYFVADVDNFVRPCALRELVALNLPIVAPFLRSAGATQLYSNYHSEVDANGYYSECDQYYWALNRHVCGIIEVPVVHTTYLIRSDVIPHLNYDDGSGRHEYVIFSASARKASVPQYLDNRQIYGYILFDKGCTVNSLDEARSLLTSDIDAHQSRQKALEKFRATLALLAPYRVADHGMVRIGHDSDGGYVMLDDLDHQMICFSLGVGQEISWDTELANRGADILQFDDGIDGPLISHPGFHFWRVRVGTHDSNNTVRLDTLVAAASLNGAYAVLKMDIEGNEWCVIDATDSAVLGQFAQIVVEFHGLSKIVDDTFNELVRRVWSRLCMTHFPIHLHGNNWGPSFALEDFECPDVLEVTFVSRRRYSPTKEFSLARTELDKPNRSDRCDYDLSRFPLVSSIDGAFDRDEEDARAQVTARYELDKPALNVTNDQKHIVLP